MQESNLAKKESVEPSGCYADYDLNGGNSEFIEESSFRKPGFVPKMETEAVVCVSREDAIGFASWASSKYQRNYRLLSEAEFEYIARKGEQRVDDCKIINGFDESARRALEKVPTTLDVLQCDDGHPNTASPEGFQADKSGIYHLLGNVYEWAQDCYFDDLTKIPLNGTAYQSAECNRYTLRGGSWFTGPVPLRPTYRVGADGTRRQSDVGFRIATSDLQKK